MKQKNWIRKDKNKKEYDKELKKQNKIQKDMDRL